MKTCFSSDDIRPATAPATAPARLPRSARHQLWHLKTPLLRALLLLSDWPQRTSLRNSGDSPLIGQSA